MHTHSLPYYSPKIYNLYSSINIIMLLIITIVLLFIIILVTKVVETYNAPLRDPERSCCDTNTLTSKYFEKC